MAKEVAVNSVVLERDENMLTLLVSRAMEPMIQDKIVSDIESALTGFYQQETRLTLQYADKIEAETPFLYEQRMQEESRLEFIEQLSESDFVQAIKTNFNAVLLEHTVKKYQ